MVLIVDDSVKRRKYELRNLLYYAGIPCAVVNSEQLRDCSPARMTVTFAENETQLSITSIRAGATDYIVVNDTGKKMINSDAYFYSWERDGIFVEFIKKRALELHGINVEYPFLYPARFNEGRAYFYNREVRLTLTEEMIVRHLMFAKGEWHTAKEIACYAYPGSGDKTEESVCVHVCNINKKSLHITGKKAILAKRYHGYSLNTVKPERKKRGPYKKKVNPPQFV